MGLSDSFLIEPAKTNIWIALRTDHNCGEGTASNPYNGDVNFGSGILVTLPSVPGLEIIADTGGFPHGFIEGDMVQISGITGPDPITIAQWNRAFSIYDVTPSTFKVALGFIPRIPIGNPLVSLVRFNFDNILRDLTPNTRVNIGPGTFQTRGYAPQGINSWQPKSGQKIVGATPRSARSSTSRITTRADGPSHPASCLAFAFAEEDKTT